LSIHTNAKSICVKLCSSQGCTIFVFLLHVLNSKKSSFIRLGSSFCLLFPFYFLTSFLLSPFWLPFINSITNSHDYIDSSQLIDECGAVELSALQVWLSILCIFILKTLPNSISEQVFILFTEFCRWKIFLGPH
jgi:hypothetical protein